MSDNKFHGLKAGTKVEFLNHFGDSISGTILKETRIQNLSDFWNAPGYEIEDENGGLTFIPEQKIIRIV